MKGANKKFEAIKKELLRDTDLTCELIAHLTGKDIHLVERMPHDKMFDYLGYLLHEEKKKNAHLHWRHNKSTEEAHVNESHAYELESKGLISNNKLRTKKFGAKPAVYEMLRILSGLAATAQMLRPGKASTAIGSNMYGADEPAIKPVVNVKAITSKPHVVNVMITHGQIPNALDGIIRK